MKNISIRRFVDHPSKHRGAVVPEDGRWQLVIDEHGDPHLFLRVFVEPGVPGWLLLEDLLPVSQADGKALTVGDLIDGEAGEAISDPAELEAAYEEYAARPHVCPV